MGNKKDMSQITQLVVDIVPVILMVQVLKVAMKSFGKLIPDSQHAYIGFGNKKSWNKGTLITMDKFDDIISEAWMIAKVEGYKKIHLKKYSKIKIGSRREAFKKKAEWAIAMDRRWKRFHLFKRSKAGFQFVHTFHIKKKEPDWDFARKIWPVLKDSKVPILQ